MRHQALRPVALMLSVLLIAGVPAQADTIRLNDVVQTAGSGQGRQAPQVRLRSLSQESNTAAANNTPRNFAPARSNDPVVTASAPSGPAAPTTSIISTGTTTTQDGGTVETIDIGDVTGTVCDCGEIPVPPGGGFPRWPLLFLPPLICLTGICDGGDRECPPGSPACPRPPDDVIPEPTTLLLLGTSLLALGAGARRRRKGAAGRGEDSSVTGEEG